MKLTSTAVPPRAEVATGAVVGATLLWSTGPLFVKAIELPGLLQAFYRLWLGVGVMVIVCLVAGRRLTKEAVRRSVPGGVLFGCNIALFFSAVKETSVTDAALISSLSPVLILFVAGRWFGERVGWQEVLWTAVAIAGVGLVILGSSGTPAWSLRGDLLAAGALVAWTAYFLVTKQVRAHVGTVEYQTIALIAAAVVLTPIAPLFESLESPPGWDWLWLFAIVLLPGATGHALMSWAHRYVAVSVSSLIIVAQPVLSGIGAAIFLDEPIGGWQVVGGAVVITAVAVVVNRHRRLEAEVVEETPAAPTAERAPL